MLDRLAQTRRRVHRGVGGQSPAPLRHGRRGHRARDGILGNQILDVARRLLVGEEQRRGRHQAPPRPHEHDAEHGDDHGERQRARPADPAAITEGRGEGEAGERPALPSSAAPGRTPTSGRATLSAAKIEKPRNACCIQR